MRIADTAPRSGALTRHPIGSDPRVRALSAAMPIIGRTGDARTILRT